MSRLNGAAAVGAAVVMVAALAAQRGGPSAPPAPGAAPAGDVLGVGTYIHLVSDVNNSIAFYSELLGAMPNGRGNAPAGPRQYAPNDVVSNLYNTPGSPFRGGTIRIANSEIGGAELVDWQAADRRRVQPRLQDPGSMMLRLTVRDLDAAAAALGRNGGSIVTPGGKPVAIVTDAGTARVLLGRDPDGFLLVVMQPEPLPPVAATATGNILGAALAVTVSDLGRAMRFYHDALGFAVERSRPFASDKAFAELAGLRRVKARGAEALIPGTAVAIEFLEFTGVERTPLGADVHGIGSSVLRLRVKDIDSTIRKLEAGGASVASANGRPVTFANGQRMAIVSDPNSIFVQPVQAAPPRPARGE